MIKKLFPFAMMSAALFLAACTDDDTVATQTQDDTSVVTFTVSQSGIQTRAFSDGTSASTLYYEVYQVTDDTLTYVSGISGSVEEAFDESLQATVTLQLVNGNEYEIIFWAQSPDTEVYSCTWDSETPSVSIKTEELTSNVEDYDAFYNTYETGVVTGDISETIYLYRPFAQLNWGTNDLTAVEAAGVTDIQTSVTISASGVGNKLYFADGSVEMSEDAVTFATADIPEGETFPVDGYEYVNMNYILFTADKATVDATLTVTGTNLDEHVVEVPQVTLQRNYRTNIYGSLLTSTASFVIEIVPEYEITDHDVPLDTVWVSSADELIDALSSAGDSDLTVVLEDDVDASGNTLDFGDGHNILDLGDNSLTAYNIINNGSLTIKGGTDEDGNPTATLTLSSSNAIYTGEDGGGTLTISGVTIEDTYAKTNSATIISGNTDGSSVGDTIKLVNTVIDTNRTGILVYGSTNIVIVDSCTINHGWFGITQQGTYLPGTSFKVTNTTISGTYSGIYLSNNANGIYNTLYVENCDITTEEESAIEVRKTDITVKSSTLTSKYSGAQKYSYSGSGSNGYGFGVMLAATSGLSTTAYQGDVTLEDITYEISASANPDGGSTPWNVCYYDGSGAAQWEDDGATE